MSWNAEKLVRKNRHLCACGHPALFIRPSTGQVAWRRDHDLCKRCWRACSASARARTPRPGAGGGGAGGVRESPWRIAA